MAPLSVREFLTTVLRQSFQTDARPPSCILQGVGLLIPFAVGVMILHRSHQDAGWAGYTLSIVQFATQSLYDFIMQIGTIDVALVTVERLYECASSSDLISGDRSCLLL